MVEEAPAWSAALGLGKANVPKLIASEAAERLEGLAKPLREKGLTDKTKVLSGKAPSVELTREVVQAGHDLLIKGVALALRRVPEVNAVLQGTINRTFRSQYQ